jgi:hypothetical protein
MNIRKIEETASNRLKLITPLLDPSMDKGQAQFLKERICNESGLSERTIRRYVNSYNEKGFEGLKPEGKGHCGKSVIPEGIMQEAIALRREVPTRSVTDIICILEWEGKTEPGFLKRSTLGGPAGKEGVFKPPDEDLCEQRHKRKEVLQAMEELPLAVRHQIRHIHRREAYVHGMFP